MDVAKLIEIMYDKKFSKKLIDNFLKVSKKIFDITI